jgi:hypothetical protein
MMKDGWMDGWMIAIGCVTHLLFAIFHFRRYKLRSVFTYLVDSPPVGTKSIEGVVDQPARLSAYRPAMECDAMLLGLAMNVEVPGLHR